MDTEYMACEDIAENTACIIVGRIGGYPYIAAQILGRDGQYLGQSSVALPKGRIVQVEGEILSLTENEKVYRVPFTLG